MVQPPVSHHAHTPLLALAVCLSLGIVAGHLLAGQSAAVPHAAESLLAISSLLAMVYLFRQRSTGGTLFVLLAFFFGGAVLMLIAAAPLPANRISQLYEGGEIRPGDPVEITGVISTQPESGGDSLYLPLEAERVRLRNVERAAFGTILLQARIADPQSKLDYESLDLTYGARLRVMTTLEREDDFRNPGVMRFTEYLKRKGYDATGSIKSPLLIERLDNARVFLPLAWLYDWRALVQARFHQLFSPEMAGVLDASLLGNELNISRTAGERLRDGGTFHVLVISGFQIAFIGGLALMFMRWFTRRRMIQSVFAAVFLWGYTLAVGAGPSVTRSALMFTLVVLAPVFSRRANSLNCLGGAALALLIWDPNNLFDPSFQLTFLSVLSIVTIAVPLIERMRRVGSWRPTHATPYPPNCAVWFRGLCEFLFWSERAWQAEMSQSTIRYRLFKSRRAVLVDRWRIQRLLRFAAAAVLVSASVQVGMLPVIIIYFHRVSIASLLLNIVVGFLIAALSLGAVLAIVIASVSHGLALPFIFLCEKINWLMIHLVDPFSRLGLASIRLPHYHGAGTLIYMLYFALLGFLVLALSSWNPLRLAGVRSGIFTPRSTAVAAAAFVLLMALTLSHPFSAARADGMFHVDFLDVGQGDAALITMPDGTTLLIDGGGQPNIDWHTSHEPEADATFARDARSIGERVVSEYLWARGLDRVDYILATHADADHIDGLNDVARNFKVRAALVARAPSNDAGYLRFAQTMRQTRVPIQQIAAGDALNFGSVSAQVLWPRPNVDEFAPSRNNDSIVLRFTFGEQTILFTGDVEKEAELSMIAGGTDLRSSLLKVAHHGSKTSSVPPFIAATHPAVAIISVGRTSVFGHPNHDVVERWRAGGAEVMTTGEKGTISVITDGRQLKLTTFVP